MKLVQLLNAYLARGLDKASQSLSKVLPSFGAYIAYNPVPCWRFAAWREPGAYCLLAGGFDVTLDRHPRAR